MRPIKFRAWDNKGGHMVEWHVITQAAFNESKMIAKAGGGYGLMYEIMTGHRLDVELMQFTGLHDKNGREIYRGDIVEYGYQSVGAGFLKWIRPVIQEKDGRFCMGGHQIEENPYMTISGAFNENVTVIGNIYENPELLEGTDSENSN